MNLKKSLVMIFLLAGVATPSWAGQFNRFTSSEFDGPQITMLHVPVDHNQEHPDGADRRNPFNRVDTKPIKRLMSSNAVREYLQRIAEAETGVPPVLR